MNRPRPELLAPAGGLDAGYAAVQYGADAVYLGLSAFSARAEAENFTAESLAHFTAYAHQATPARRVYVTVNTLPRDDERDAALSVLADAAEAGVDAWILQDMGLASLARRHFPSVARHASTQLAVHNAEGVRWAADHGFARVTLAREMTLDEIRRAASVGRDRGVEVEVFAHGALCYGFSGLCLAGGVLRGRSGNRGRCGYPCRAFARIENRDDAGPARDGLAFSLNDMARDRDVEALADAGVASLKIEGRKKSPLYVAATVALYRARLDGASPKEAQRHADDARAIFARPWTRYFLDGDTQGDHADPDVTGHRGLPCGTVEAVRAARTDAPSGRGVVWRTTRALERHDGVQFDKPDSTRPWGFAIDAMRRVERAHDERVFDVPAGARVWVALPPDAPSPPVGATVYCAASQATKRSYPVAGVRPASYRTRFGMSARVTLAEGTARVEGRVDPTPRTTPTDYARPLAETSRAYATEVDVTGLAATARDAAGADAAARKAFSRLGETRLTLAEWEGVHPSGMFLPAAAWNAVRRAAAEAAEAALRAHRADVLAAAGTEAERAWGGERTEHAASSRAGESSAPPSRMASGGGRSDGASTGFADAAVAADVVPHRERGDDGTDSTAATPRWSLAVDAPSALNECAVDDVRGVEEFVVSMFAPGRPAEAETDAAFVDALRALSARLTPSTDPSNDRRGDDTPFAKLRVALPTVIRDRRDREAVDRRMDVLRAAGCTRWIAANVGAAARRRPGEDWTADAFLYATHRAAARFWWREGFTRITLSPEESVEAWLRMASGLTPEERGRCVVLVYGDLPLFWSAVCAHRTLTRTTAPGACPFGPDGRCAAETSTGGGCRARPLRMTLDDRDTVRVFPHHGGTVVTTDRPSWRMDRSDALRRAGLTHWRADFRWRRYTPSQVTAAWRALRTGSVPPVPAD